MTLHSEHTNPVFFDKSGVRRYAVSLFGWCGFALLVAVFASLSVSTVNSGFMTQLKLHGKQRTISPGVRSVSETERKPTAPATAPNASVARDASTTRYAHLVTWDNNSFSSLKANASKLDVLVAEWLTIAHQDQTLTSIDPVKEAQVRKWLRDNAPDLKVFPYITNYNMSAGTWDGASAMAILNSPDLRQTFMRQVGSYLDDSGFQGVAINFEQLDADYRQRLSAFVIELAGMLHAKGKQLIVEVTADDPVYDETAIAAVADGVSVTLFDEHAENEEPGPIASYGWFTNELDRALKVIPRAKLIVEVGAYGYDWPANGPGHEISVQEAWELLAELHGALTFDRGSLTPSFNYIDDDDHSQHSVAFLDAVTLHNQLLAIQSKNVAGVGLWRLGTEDPVIWREFAHGSSASSATVEPLNTIATGYDVLYLGAGEILQVEGKPEQGVRHLTTNAGEALITNEQVLTLPKSTVVKRFGADDDKKLAITFDDGPNATYTPQILDVLASRNVKATFFVVGSAGVVNREVLRRIYAEGHDIGNHTFSHLETGNASVERIRYELNATQSLLEATLGVRTTLFRPPYAEDLEPRTIDEAATLRTASELGYVSVGMNIDPKDWFRQIADQIVNKTLEGVHTRSGNIILLHDSGGPRSATVAALPRIIDALRAEGYRFVPVHELLGMQRDDVMPLPPAARKWSVVLNFLGFGGLWLFNLISVALFFVGVTLGIARSIVLSVLAYKHKKRERARACNASRPSSVTALVPAFNEREVICKSVRSLLASQNVDLKIIVIDDGSTDGTADVVRAEFKDNARVTVITKPNAGKWSALNTGLASTNDDIVITLDADTIFAPDAVALMARHFADPEIAAIAGHATIGNVVNFLTRFQTLEYLTNQNLDRRALEMLNGITVVPGSIGAWRRSALEEIGGFASDTLAEDADATVRLGIAGYKIVYEPKALALTEAPETVAQFMKQRLRWMFGTLQVAYKNRAAMSGKTGVGAFGLPNILVFQFFFTLMAPVADCVLLWSIIAELLNQTEGTVFALPLSLETVALYWATFQVVEIASAAFAIWLDERDRPWRLLGVLLLQRFCYRQLLYVTAIRVLIAAMRGTLQGWGKLKQDRERQNRLWQPRNCAGA